MFLLSVCLQQNVVHGVINPSVLEKYFHISGLISLQVSKSGRGDWKREKEGANVVAVCVTPEVEGSEANHVCLKGK